MYHSLQFPHKEGVKTDSIPFGHCTLLKLVKSIPRIPFVISIFNKDPLRTEHSSITFISLSHGLFFRPCSLLNVDGARKNWTLVVSNCKALAGLHRLGLGTYLARCEICFASVEAMSESTQVNKRNIRSSTLPTLLLGQNSRSKTNKAKARRKDA